MLCISYIQVGSYIPIKTHVSICKYVICKFQAGTYRRLDYYSVFCWMISSVSITLCLVPAAWQLLGKCSCFYLEKSILFSVWEAAWTSGWIGALWVSPAPHQVSRSPSSGVFIRTTQHFLRCLWIFCVLLEKGFSSQVGRSVLICDDDQEGDSDRQFIKENKHHVLNVHSLKDTLLATAYACWLLSPTTSCICQ